MRRSGSTTRPKLKAGPAGEHALTRRGPSQPKSPGNRGGTRSVNRHALGSRQQRIVKLARATVTAKPHAQKRIAHALVRMDLTASEKRLANRAAAQHDKHLQSKQQGLLSTSAAVGRGAVEAATGVDPAHPLRRKLGGSGAANLALGVATITPIGRALRGVKTLARAGKASEKAARAVPKVQPHIGTFDEGVESVPGRAHERGYSYHYTTPARLKQIQREGLKAAKPQGNPEGVYFGNEPLVARGLSQKRTASVYVRVHNSKLRGVEQRAFGETRVSHDVPASHLEYLGKDGKWHSVAEPATARPAGRKMSFPAEMPAEVRSSAHRLARGIDKPKVKALRKQQEKLYSVERGKRAKVAEAALKKHAGTPHAMRIAKSKLAGELPKVTMRGALGEFGEQDLNTLRGYVHTHKGLRLFDKINVEDALEKTIAGRPPTEGDRLLLHRVFGKEFVNRVEQPTRGARLARGAAEVANVPRSLESSFDVSAPLRQGLVALARHPGMTSKNVGPMLKAFKNEGAYDKTMAEIAKRPNYQKMRESGLAITDIHSGIEREEFFPSNLAERIPVAGRGVKASGRAYHGFLAKTRADMFDKHLANAAKAGYDGDDPHLLGSLATFINAATGRGDIGKLAPAARALSAAFFSPRLLASRINFLNPVWYARLHPYARRQAIRSAAQLAAFVTGILEVAHAAGADVETDPRSTDWAKIRVGDTRVDLLGGFQPVIRASAQVSTGSRKTSRGEIAKLEGGFGQQSRLDVASRFFRGKLAPVPSAAGDVLGGATFIGDPVTAKGEAWQRLTPFGVQDAVDVFQNTKSVPAAAGSFGLTSFGAGVQSYDSEATGKKKIRRDQAVLRDALTKDVRRYFHRDLTPEIKKALRLREVRETYLHENLGSRATARERYDAQVDLLLRLKKVTPAQAKHAKAWASRRDDHELRYRTSAIGRKYFGGDVLSSATKKLRDRGGKLYLSDY